MTSQQCEYSMSLLQSTRCSRMGISAAYRPTVYSYYLSLPWRTGPQRAFTCAAILASGHNRWSKIKHDKGNADRAKSKLRSMLSRDLILASKREDKQHDFPTSRFVASRTDLQNSWWSKPDLQSPSRRSHHQCQKRLPSKSFDRVSYCAGTG